MKCKEKQNIFIRFYNSKEFGRLFSLISFILTIFIFNNYCVILANLGDEKMQIHVADEARKNCDYSTAQTFYGKISDSDSVYAPYAALSRLEIYDGIYSNAIDLNDFTKCFLKAAKSNDIRVLKSCLYFLANRIDWFTNEDIPADISIFSDNNIGIVKEMLNSINEEDESLLENIGLEFPLDDDDIRYIFIEKGLIDLTYFHWEYESTINTEESGLSKIDDNEKILLAEICPQLVNKLGTEMITIYKYYKYKKVIDKAKSEPAIDILKNKEFKPVTLYLSQIDFDSLDYAVDKVCNKE